MKVIGSLWFRETWNCTKVQGLTMFATKAQPDAYVLLESASKKHGLDGGQGSGGFCFHQLFLEDPLAKQVVFWKGPLD